MGLGSVYRGLAQMNADYFLDVERSRPRLRLFIGLGILFQGKFQQPAERLSPRFKSFVEPEILDLSKQILFQAQLLCCKLAESESRPRRRETETS